MRSLLLATAVLTAFSVGLRAAPLPMTPYTVVAQVESFEHYRALGGNQRFSMATPHGNEETVIAKILQPESLAGREIAIPFESRKDGKELLVQRGTVFRFEHRMNLSDLRDQTERIRRRAIEFPALGIIVPNADGGVAEAYEGSLTALAVAELKKKSAP